jgi:hypothetical protein
MRTISYRGQILEVEIVSLARPRERGLMGRGFPSGRAEPNLTINSPTELAIGAEITLHQTEGQDAMVRVLGCAPRPDGRFIVLATVLT